MSSKLSQPLTPVLRSWQSNEKTLYLMTKLSPYTPAKNQNHVSMMPLKVLTAKAGQLKKKIFFSS